MSSLNALSHTPVVRDWLINSQHSRILHVFERVCNLINERGEVLSLVTPQIGNGPFNLVIENDVCFSKQLSLESPVSLSHTQLQLGDLIIQTADAYLWHPLPDWVRLHASSDEILNQLMSLRALIRAKQSPRESGMIASLQTTLLAMTGISNYQSPILIFSNALTSSLADADLSSSIEAAQQLAGLGTGLTPSGDDFIMGAILAAWILHPPKIAKALAENIAAIAAPLTTSLSAAWLRSAGRGEAGILWHEFFDALISGNSARIQESVEKILAVGETSGADALSGFLGTMDGNGL